MIHYKPLVRANIRLPEEVKRKKTSLLGGFKGISNSPFTKLKSYSFLSKPAFPPVFIILLPLVFSLLSNLETGLSLASLLTGPSWPTHHLINNQKLQIRPSKHLSLFSWPVPQSIIIAHILYYSVKECLLFQQISLKSRWWHSIKKCFSTQQNSASWCQVSYCK